MIGARLVVREGESQLTDEALAVKEIHEQVSSPDASLILFFCSSRYDLPRLGAALAQAFSIPVIGCTSAGSIGSAGYSNSKIAAISLASPELRVAPYLLSQLDDSTEATNIAYRAVADLVRQSSRKAFGLLLIDGLSRAEERVTSALYPALGYVPLVGGSAADDLAFENACVYYDGKFRRRAAVLTIFDTTLPFSIFRVQDVRATGKKVVITRADAEQRRVFEINGKPAVSAYAGALGIADSELTALHCARHPLLLRLGEDSFVRGVRSVNADGSLVFSCAVEEGLVLTLGESTSALSGLQEGLSRATEQVGEPRLIIGFDCVTRRLELERLGQLEKVGAFLASARVFGCSTYGEQYEAIHVTQTFTGVAIGG